MGTTITKEQNSSAANAAAQNLSARFSDAGITVEIIAHNAGKRFEFVRIICSPEQWRAVAKHLKNELGVNHCAMVTGTHYPEGGDRGWEVAYHMHRWPITDVEAHTMIVHSGEDTMQTTCQYGSYDPIFPGYEKLEKSVFQYFQDMRN